MNWIYYCYYRSVKFYSESGEKPEYLRGLIPFFAWFAVIDGVILIILKPEVTETYRKYHYWLSIPIVIVLIIIMRQFLNAETYKKMDELFGSESERYNIIMGILVFLTFAAPVIALLTYTFWRIS